MIVTTSAKSQLFETHQILTQGGDLLHAAVMTPKPPVKPKRVVFISPLIGAAAVAPLLTFRNLARSGSILISFEHRGHTRSTGTFELDKAVVDVEHAMVWAWDYASQRGLPLHGFATCFGNVALLAQFKKQGYGPILRSITQVAGLLRMDQILRAEDFVPIFARHLGRELPMDEFMAGVAAQSFDWDGDAFRGALHEYIQGLFRHLRVGRDFFEQLQYGRTNIPLTILQLSRAAYLEGIQVPPEIPYNVFIGTDDDALDADTPEGLAAYKQEVLGLVPHASIFEGEFDHFGRGTDHGDVIDHIAELYDRHDAHVVPPPHFNQVVESLRRRPR